MTIHAQLQMNYKKHKMLMCFPHLQYKTQFDDDTQAAAILCVTSWALPYLLDFLVHKLK